MLDESCAGSVVVEPTGLSLDIQTNEAEAVADEEVTDLSSEAVSVTPVVDVMPEDEAGVDSAKVVSVLSDVTVEALEEGAEVVGSVEVRTVEVDWIEALKLLEGELVSDSLVLVETTTVVEPLSVTISVVTEMTGDEGPGALKVWLSVKLVAVEALVVV